MQSNPVNTESYTSIMMRRLPASYRRAELMHMLDSHGFQGSYDFLYLPVDFEKWVGFGYAFVNMVSNEEAVRAIRYFDGFSAFPGNAGADVDGTMAPACDVTWGEPLQGLKAHIERYRNSPVMHKGVPEQFKPITFSKGVKVKFPSPTARIRPPRLKHGVPAEPPADAAAHMQAEADAAGGLPMQDSERQPRI